MCRIYEIANFPLGQMKKESAIVLMMFQHHKEKGPMLILEFSVDYLFFFSILENNFYVVLFLILQNGYLPVWGPGLHS